MFKVIAVLGAALLFPAIAPAAHRDSGPSAAQVAAQICSNLQQQLGSAFSSTYGSPEQCGQQLASKAQTIVDGCTATGQAGTPAFRDCIQAGITQAVQQLTGSTSGTITLAPSSTQVAGDICGDLRQDLGATFSSAFGSLGGCKAKLVGTAQNVISGCVSKAQPGTTTFNQCMDSGIDAAVRLQRKAIAKQVCASLQRTLGKSAFAKKYGSPAKCQIKKGGG